MNNKKTSIIAASIVALAAITFISFNVRADDQDTGGIKNFGQRLGMHQNLTDQQKTEFATQRNARRAENQGRHEEMLAVMNQGYDAWVAKVKEMSGDSAPILSKINSSNFAQFVKAHQNMETARAELLKLGVEPGDCGMGVKGGQGGRGMHRGAQGL